MDKNISEIVSTLEELLDENLSIKSKNDLSLIIDELKKSKQVEELMKVQDDLEYFSSSANINSFIRNEIMNIIAEIETML